MFETTLAGSLPKPSWLATPNVLWAPWTLTGAPLLEAKDDATALAIRRQEEAGIDIVSDGEQARQHFVHGFLAEVDGVDFDKKVRMGIRNNRYDADCPTVTSALKRRKFVHEREARVARAATSRKLKFTLPGPMTLIDTLADGFYGDRVKMAFAFAELLNQEAKDLEKAGVDVVQFDEPAFNVYLDETVDWGVPALEKAAEGLKCTTAVHICYGYGIEANIKWKETLGESWRQYEKTFPALDRSRIQQVSLECRESHVPPELMKLLPNKTVLVGAIDVASDKIETPEEVAATLKLATKFVDPERIQACTNCGMAPMTLATAYGKLRALAEGRRWRGRRFNLCWSAPLRGASAYTAMSATEWRAPSNEFVAADEPIETHGDSAPCGGHTLAHGRTLRFELLVSPPRHLLADDPADRRPRSGGRLRARHPSRAHRLAPALGLGFPVRADLRHVPRSLDQGGAARRCGAVR